MSQPYSGFLHFRINPVNLNINFIHNFIVIAVIMDGYERNKVTEPVLMNERISPLIVVCAVCPLTTLRCESGDCEGPNTT